jgi:hypothetical protein
MKRRSVLNVTETKTQDVDHQKKFDGGFPYDQMHRRTEVKSRENPVGTMRWGLGC